MEETELTEDTDDRELSLSELQTMDFCLRALAATANANRGNSVGVTVLVGGQLMSGMLMCAADWYADRIAEAEEIESVVGAAIFRGVGGDIVDETPSAGEEFGLDLDVLPNFLHLRDVRVFANGSWLLSPVSPRIKISSVDGWAMGIASSN